MKDTFSFLMGLTILDILTLSIFIFVIFVAYKIIKFIPEFVEKTVNNLVVQETLDIHEQMMVTTTIDDILSSIRIFNTKKEFVSDVFVFQFDFDNEVSVIDENKKIKLIASTVNDETILMKDYSYDFFSQCISAMEESNYIYIPLTNPEKLSLAANYFTKVNKNAKWLINTELRDSDMKLIGFVVYLITVNDPLSPTQIRSTCNFAGFISFKLEILLRQKFRSYTNDIQSILKRNNITFFSVLKSIIFRGTNNA